MQEETRRDGQTLVSRSTIYAALALALQPPNARTLRWLKGSNNGRSMRRAAFCLHVRGWAYPPRQALSLGERNPDLLASASSWISTFPTLSLDSLRVAHGRLFGHTARGQVSPYETEYGPGALFQQPHQLASLTGFYAAFGLQVRHDERERPDHVCCQLEFMEFLVRKRVYALVQEDHDMRERTSRAERLFLKDHLARFARAFSNSLSRSATDDFFSRAGDLLSDFVTLECRQLGIDAGPIRMSLRYGRGGPGPHGL